MATPLVIDCNYICYVNKFALSVGLNYKGGRTEIIFGFLRHILELAEKFNTKEFYFCWDSKESIRKTIYPEYKANRRVADNRTEEDLEADVLAYNQFDILREKVLPNIGFNNIFHLDGYESDDLIAYVILSKRWREFPIVVSADQDLYQLLDDCSVYNLVKKETMSKTIFTRSYGITPKQWIKIKQIAGCHTDNVKGVPGVGEKKALAYITSNMNPNSKSFADISSKEGQDIIKRNYDLVCLPYPKGVFPKDKLFHKEDKLSWPAFKIICEKFGFKSFMKDEYEKRWKKFFR